MWTVETDANHTQAVSITRVNTWSQSGRLGWEFSTPDHAAALDAALALREAGWMVYFEPDRKAQSSALDGLAAYREARARMAEYVHAALASGSSKADILRASGLSRAGLDRAIERWSLSEFTGRTDL